MADVTKILRETRALIEAIEQWTQGTDARDCLGNDVDPASPHATCWCASGALEVVVNRNGGGGTHAPHNFLNAAAEQLFDNTYVLVNDGGPGNRLAAHANILRVFDRAIELASA